MSDDIQAKAREIAAGLSPKQRWVLGVCREHPVDGASVRGIGAGKGVATTARALERLGLVVVDRRHWRDHTARATDLGRAVADVLAESSPSKPESRP